MILPALGDKNIDTNTMIETITVSSRGQMVIPERMRKELGIVEGMKLVLVEDKEGIRLEKEEEFLKKIPKIGS